jgi:hypothetical protein
MLDHACHSSLDPERRREAVRVGRRALGPGLQQMFGDVLSSPAPKEWLELLRRAEERERTTKR